MSAKYLLNDWTDFNETLRNKSLDWSQPSSWWPPPLVDLSKHKKIVYKYPTNIWWGSSWEPSSADMLGTNWSNITLALTSGINPLLVKYQIIIGWIKKNLGNTKHWVYVYNWVIFWVPPNGSATTTVINLNKLKNG